MTKVLSTEAGNDAAAPATIMPLTRKNPVPTCSKGSFGRPGKASTEFLSEVTQHIGPLAALSSVMTAVNRKL